MSRDVVTVVTAAGKGQRLGGPKALLLWPTGRPTDSKTPFAESASNAEIDASAHHKEIPLAIAHADARLAAESSRVLIVTRRTLLGVLLPYVRPGIDLFASDAPDELGPAGSIAYAASRLGDAPIVLVTPVDTPPARAETTRHLLASINSGDPPPLAVRPRYAGHAGHPVILRAEALLRYRSPSPPPLRDYLHSLGPRCLDVPVDDPYVQIDFNTPEDFLKVLRRRPRFLPV